MCKCSSTQEQRLNVINLLKDNIDHIQNAPDYPYPVLYRCVNTICGHQQGSCNIDKENFIEMMSKSIEMRKWDLTKKMFNMWDKMLSNDIINGA